MMVQIICGSKEFFYGSKKFVGQKKIWVKKNFGSKKILGQKIFASKNFCIKKYIFGTKTRASRTTGAKGIKFLQEVASFR